MGFREEGTATAVLGEKEGTCRFAERRTRNQSNYREPESDKRERFPYFHVPLSSTPRRFTAFLLPLRRGIEKEVTGRTKSHIKPSQGDNRDVASVAGFCAVVVPPRLCCPPPFPRHGNSLLLRKIKITAFKSSHIRSTRVCVLGGCLALLNRVTNKKKRLPARRRETTVRRH